MRTFVSAIALGTLILLSSVRPSDAEIIHRWSFDTDASDSVGGAHGSLEAGATVSDGRVILDGQRAHVQLPIGDTMERLTNSTFEAWVTWDARQRPWLRLFDFGTGPGESLYVTPRNGRSDAGSSTNTLRFTITPVGDPAEQQVNTPLEFPVNEETHVVLTIDADNDVARLYVNGELIAEQEEVTLSPADLGNTTNNWLGRSQFGSDPYFGGSISEFRIHDAALTAEQVAQSFERGPDQLEPRPTTADVATAEGSTAADAVSHGCCQPCPPRRRVRGRFRGLFGRRR